MIMKTKDPPDPFFDVVSEIADNTAKLIQQWARRCIDVQERAIEACIRSRNEWSVGHPYCVIRQPITPQDGRAFIVWQEPRAAYV